MLLGNKCPSHKTSPYNQGRMIYGAGTVIGALPLFPRRHATG